MSVIRWVVSALLAAIALSSPVAALEFVVTRLDDPAPDGCIAGDCSLREAVITANQLSGPDRILLPAGLVILSRTTGGSGASVGDLDLLDAVEIIGSGAETTVILASPDNRHFNVTPGVVATIRQLRLDGGRAQFGGAILDNGSLTLEDAILTSNQATGDGGALRSAAGTPAIVRRVQFIGNSTAGNGGAIFSGSGAHVSDSLFDDNSALRGGAIYGYDLRVRASLFTDNTGIAGGGAIYGAPGSSASYAEIVGSTFVGNQAGSKSLGGALHLAHGFAVTSSTFSANSAGADGAIHTGNANLGERRIVASTFTGNNASGPGSAVHYASANNAHLMLFNNIVSGSCFRNGAGSGGFRGDGNVESPGNSCALGGGQNLVNVGAAALALGVLTDNGGSTPTHAPAANSVAVGAGSQAECERLDQRGRVRHDGDCDAGSVEVGALDDVLFRNGFGL